MNGESTFGEGSWIFGLIVLLGLFGGFNGGFGNNNANAAYATMADVNSAINNQSTQQALAAVQLSSANNNYETAQLINAQTLALSNINSENTINAIQGFNNIGQQIMNQTNVIGSKLDQLGFQMENCCCSIKTLIKDNQIADLTNQLNQVNNVAVNSAQSQYLLSQMGKWVANAPATAAAYTATK